MSRRLISAATLCLSLLTMSLGVTPAAAQLTQLGATQAATGHTSVIHGIAYAARHDVYLTVYEAPDGIRGRFVNAAGAPVGGVFSVAALGQQALVYANKPMVAYSTDTADDTFFVMYATDFGKAPDAQPGAWIQRVSFTGTGGARVGNPIQVGDGGWEIPNDIIYNPATRQFVAVWERFFGSGPDVMVRFFNADGTAATGIINVSAANHGQGAAKAAVDWERNRILIAYQGLHPNSPTNPEVLGLWAKVIDGTTGALLTTLIQVQSGFTIEAMPVFMPEVDGFLVTWTGFNPGRDVVGRYVSSADGAVGASPNPVYIIAGSSRQEGAPMGMYDAISRRILMAVQSSGACPNDTCPYLDGAVLDHQGVVLSSFTGLSTPVPSATGGSFYPDVAPGEGGQFGFSYTLNYSSVYVERASLPAASTPGPQFGGGTPTVGLTTSPTSLSFSVTKNGSTLGSVTPRAVALTFSSGTAGAWSAATTAPWLQLATASGSGNGQFTATVINPSNVIGSQTSLSGSIVITAATAPNAPITIPVTVAVSSTNTSGGALSQQGATQLATGHTSVVHGIAYSPRHDVYLTVYESPNGVRGRFMNTAGQPVGEVFAIATTPGQASSYANKPMVAYSHDTADDVFFVMYGSDYTKAADAVPSTWIQRVSFTGTGGARVGNPIAVGDGGWEIPNDLVYNPATRQFVAVWERFFGSGPDVMVRFFNTDGSAGTGIVNVSAANHGQGAAKAAVDWERNRILIAYQGLHPNSAVNPETLGLWAKIVDGTSGALLTGLLTAQAGFTIEAMPVFLPEVDGFLVTWTGFNPGRDVLGRYVSSLDASLGAMPNPIYAIAGSARSEGAPMGKYDAISRRVLMAVQSSGGCPNDTCPFVDGAILTGDGAVTSSFTGLSTVAPSATGGSFYPDVAVGEGGQFGLSYSLNYFSIYNDRIVLSAADTPGPQFGGTTNPATGATMAPSNLSMAILKAGAQINAGNPSVVTVTFSTGTAGAWTVASSVPWLQVISGSGSGDGQFSVRVINPSNVIGSQTTLSGSVILTAATAPNSPVTLPVSVSVSTVSLPAAVPFGQVDTPLQSAVGLQGAIAITGWALDDTGVTSVNVYRNCYAFDVQAACQTILGHRIVFLGQAAFLPGARSDVEGAYPLFPNAARAGWGIQILTNQLPHVPTGQTTGGQGAITFYAIATDTVGNVKVLGRSSAAVSGDFSTPTSVTLANDSIAKPFGSLDTPALGATVSGTIPNFGWALTPDDDTTVGNVDKIVPTDGSTVTVYIDGVARATVMYNQCRGTVGNPLAAGVFCNDDISNTFGNASPQASLTARTSNPTRYRNLDAGRGAIGAYVLDTTTLSNGLHTIAWAVMDSAGRTEGIGSRFFTVANPAAEVGRAGFEARQLAAAEADGSVARAPEGRDGVWGRTGFDPRVPWLEMTPDAEGQRTVRLDEMGRLELWLGAPIESAFVVANGTNQPLRALPTGSAVDGPQFSWAPGPGQVGTYQLAFMRGGERVDVYVTIAPPAGVRDDEPAIRMSLDDVRSTGRDVRVSGTAFDPHAAIGSGVEAVHVWARAEVPGSRSPEVIFLGEATLSGNTFSLTAPLASGTWQVTAYAWNRRTMRFEDARSASVTIR